MDSEGSGRIDGLTYEEVVMAWGALVVVWARAAAAKGTVRKMEERMACVGMCENF